MTDYRKIQLEKLLKKNKVKEARMQLINDLKKYHNIDISNHEYVDYQVSEEVHKKVYEQIKSDDIKSLKFPFNEETVKSKIDFIFGYFKDNEKETVMFFPSTFGFYFRNSNQLYLDYPIAIRMSLLDCKKIVLTLMFEMHDDLVVVSDKFKFGFVLSEDEYSTVTIEDWEK
ncbi:hypothetical protein [Cohnella sp. WQ 127256]|uniref:hypothetical protein n=1 Tax=Cohnella sp. WQ 127256 TaxID=2938790 RepID=UPI0021172D8C|nr:hypothetical protein [Cohnella sp. WQ 127256]